MRDLRFTCSGNVTAWQYKKANNNGSVVYAGIWREDSTGSLYLVSKTELSDTTAGDYLFQLSESVPVENGYFIGLHYAGGDATPAIGYCTPGDTGACNGPLTSVTSIPAFDSDLTPGVPFPIASFGNVSLDSAAFQLAAHLGRM